MMIKCQKCGFENQMGSIFCRECGEKLDMNAIDPNKLQKDVNKEKSIKRAKKRIKEAISYSIALIVIIAFLAVVFYNGGLRKYEESSVSEAVARQKYNSATNGTAVGKVKFTYPEVNRMFKDMVVDPIAQESSFATVTGAEIAYDEEKQKPVIYLWLTLKDKVPVIYTIHGDIVLNPRNNDSDEDSSSSELVSLDVSRLDIGRLPLFVSTHSFLDGFSSLLQNDKVEAFFDRATGVQFTADGMTVEYGKAQVEDSGRPNTMPAPSSAGKSSAPSSAPAKSALKGSANDEKAEAARRKAEEENEKKKQLEEERKRKAEEYKQQQREKEEERKRKAEEEKKKREQEAEERKRKQEEENERRRQERENRRNDRYNNNYNNNNSRNSRSSRSSRNRY